MSGSKIMVLGVCLFALQGCASTAKIEAEQLAWRGPGAGPCMFGGVTDRSVAHCARVNFGDRGLMQIVNSSAGGNLAPGAKCTDHAKAVVALLRNYPDVSVQPIYTCPSRNGLEATCHVSILATGADGQRYVLDNGAILADDPEHVGTLAEFSVAVGGRYWLDTAPTMAQALSLDEIFADLDVTLAAKPN